MADNVAITAGAGTAIAADDIGSVFYQRVKPQLGADGSATDMLGGAGAVAAGVQRTTLASDDPAVTALQLIDNAVETNRFGVNLIASQIGIAGGTGVDGVTVPRVSLATNVGLPAGTAYLGKMGGTTATVAVTLSLDTSAYASGDVLADTQQVDAALRVADGTGVLQSVMVYDQDDQKAAMTLYFLQANVAMGTENSAPSITDANSLNILGFLDVAVGDYKDLGGVSVASFKNVGIPLKAVSGTDDIYVAAVNGTGTPTYTASGVKLGLGILQD
jgi:hypothetical protein